MMHRPHRWRTVKPPLWTTAARPPPPLLAPPSQSRPSFLPCKARYTLPMRPHGCPGYGVGSAHPLDPLHPVCYLPSMDTYDEDHTQTTPEDAIEALMPGMSPAAVIEAMEDPGVFEQLSRGMLYEQMVTLRALAVNQSFPLSQRMELAKWLSKMGKVESPVQNLPTGAQLPMIQIVFPNAHRTTTISGTKQSHPVIDVISDD